MNPEAQLAALKRAGSFVAARVIAVEMIRVSDQACVITTIQTGQTTRPGKPGNFRAYKHAPGKYHPNASSRKVPGNVPISPPPHAGSRAKWAKGWHNMLGSKAVPEPNSGRPAIPSRPNKTLGILPSPDSGRPALSKLWASRPGIIALRAS